VFEFRVTPDDCAKLFRQKKYDGDSNEIVREKVAFHWSVPFQDLYEALQLV
jgi:hypothetical protein